MLKIKKLKARQEVYDITVQDNHNFFANDILVHNCQEINLPTRPLTHVHDENGRIALCTLSAINWGNINSLEDMETICDLAVRGLDALIDFQSYPLAAAEIGNKASRPIGVGIINFAYWLAKNDLTYQHIDAAGLAKVHEMIEAQTYFLHKASINLAKEVGKCDWYNETKYSQGLLPIDTYKSDVDELCAPVYKMDWESLRKDLELHGIRNSSLSALMPSETSAQVGNATNGIEPPRALVSVKQSKDGVLKQVVPEIRRLKNKYDLLWDQRSPLGYLKICAVLQKFIDQGISVNTSYNPAFYEDEQIPLSELLQHMLFFYKYGGKQLYYFNLNDGAGEMDINKAMADHAQDTAMPIDYDDNSCR